METYPVEFYAETYEVSLYVDEYLSNGRLAILLISEDGDDFADLTVNLPGEECPEGCAYLDTNNLPSAEYFVMSNGLGEFTGHWGYSGFCSYPLYRFDTGKISGKEISRSVRKWLVRNADGRCA